MESLIPLAPFVLVGLVAIGAAWWQAHQRRILEDGLARLMARDRLHLTDRPGGFDRTTLAGRFAATPRGDRRYGVRYGVEGPVEVSLDGTSTRVQVACFQWWYEARVRSNKTTTYHRRTTTVALARLPIAVPGRIELRPEGLLGRTGIVRRDQQLESEEFNRRFHVDGSDETLTLRFLDARMQHRLVTTAVGRTIHLEADVLVLGGEPTHRDGSLPGVIGQLPAVAQDVVGLLAAVPDQLWRAARAARGAEEGRA